MCLACIAPAPSRRAVLGGLAALAAAAVAPGAAQAAACFDLKALSGTAAERLRRRATAADVVSAPVPAAPAAPVAGPASGVVRRVEPRGGEKLVALTFDLCQTRGAIAGYDGAVVDYLREERVPATFFAGGLWLETHRDRAVQLAADPLFRLGNHSWSHHDLHSAGASVVAKEILLTEAAIASVHAAAAAKCGLPVKAGPRLFRFPYGSCAAARRPPPIGSARSWSSGMSCRASPTAHRRRPSSARCSPGSGPARSS